MPSTAVSQPSLPDSVSTTRLVLRRQHPNDALLIKEAVDSSLDHLQASVAWAQSAPELLAALQARLAASAAAFDAGEAWTFSILDRALTRVLGGAGLHRPDRALETLVGPGALETGYWLRADVTGHGYATEATACLVDLAFTHLNAQRVAICHDPANVSSSGIPRRLGFRCVGTVTADALPGRQAANGSTRAATRLWVLGAPGDTRRAANSLRRE